MIHNKKNSSEIVKLCKLYTARFDPAHSVLGFKITNETLSVLAVLFSEDIRVMSHPFKTTEDVEYVEIKVEREKDPKDNRDIGYTHQRFFPGSYLVVLGEYIYRWDAERFDQAFNPGVNVPAGILQFSKTAFQEKNIINGDLVTVPWKGVVQRVLDALPGEQKEYLVQLEDMEGTQFDWVRFKESEIISYPFRTTEENKSGSSDDWTQEWAVAAFTDASLWKKGMRVVVTDSNHYQGWMGVVRDRNIGKIPSQLVPICFEGHGVHVDLYPSQLERLENRIDS